MLCLQNKLIPSKLFKNIYNLTIFLSKLLFSSGRFALDVHWRFLMMFGTIVMKVPRTRYEEVLMKQRAACGVADNMQLDVDSLNAVVLIFKELAEV